MIRSSRSLLMQMAVSGVVTLLLYAFLKTFPGHDLNLYKPTFHFYVVTPTLLLATLGSLIIGIIGIRLRNVNVLLLALSLLSLSGFFLIHALGTPGFILANPFHLPGVSSQIALTTCAIWLVLSSVPSDKSVIRFISKHRQGFVLGWLVLIVISNVVALMHPHIADFIPVDSHPLNNVFAVITIGLFAWAGQRYFQQFRFARFPMQRAIVSGALWLSLTEFAMVTTMMWTPAWWFYHVLLVISTVTLLYGVVAQYKSKASMTHTLAQMFSTQPMDRIRIGISHSMQKLIVATESKDSYTAGHNFRVAVYALQLAEAMEVEPELLRALAQGGVIHDVGKIQVPGEILNKPGSLTPEERAIIEQHPVTGYELCKRIGFMTEELGVIRHHHEKWDGTGYPDCLQGEQIPLLARILAVADVYDALTSHRAYREPWSHERAMGVIEEGAGTHFDPICVSAWVALCNSGHLVNPESQEEFRQSS